MKKHILSTIIFLAGTTFQIYAPIRPEIRAPETASRETSNSSTASDPREFAAERSTIGNPTQAKLSAEIVNSTTSTIQNHNIVAEVNATFGGKLKLQDQSNLSSAIDKAKNGNPQDLEKLDALLTAFASKYKEANKSFNANDFLTGLHTVQKNKSLSDKISSAFNYVKLQFSHAINAVNPRGVSIDLNNISIPVKERAPEPATRQTDDMPVAQQNIAAGFEFHTAPKTKKTFEPERSIKDLKVNADNASANLTDASGAIKVTIDISSTKSGLIRSINSSANPVTIAQSISEVLTKASKPSSPIQPFTAAEISKLGSYIKQMNEGHLKPAGLADYAVGKIADYAVGKMDAAQEKAYDQIIASNDFNTYLRELLDARGTNLNHTQLLNAIKTAESKKGIIQTIADNVSNPARMALAPTPEYSHPTISGAVTFAKPIRVLPEGVHPVSSIENFKTFSASLKSQLDSMNPTQAKEAIAKLLGNDTNPDNLGETLSSLSDTIEGNTSFSHLFPEQIVQINNFLERISDPKQEPIELTATNFAQVKAGLDLIVHETLNPSADYPIGGKPVEALAESASPVSLSQSIHDRIMNSQLENYPTQISKLLSKKLGSDLQLLAKTSEAITVQFEYLKDAFIKNGYPAKDAAIKAMDVLLVIPGEKPLSRDELTTDMDRLNSFLKKPTFNADTALIINDLLKTMNSDVTLTPENCLKISESLSPLKDILKIALPEAEAASKPLFTTAAPRSGSIEDFAPKYIESVLQLKEGRTRINESLPVLTQETISLKDSCVIITKGLSDQLTKRTLFKDGIAQVVNSLLRSNKGIYDISNPDAKAQLVSDITTLNTFLETPTFVEDSKNNQVINNILKNLKIDLTLTSTNYIRIKGSLKPLDPVLKFALDGLKTQLTSPVAALPEIKMASDSLLTNAESSNPQELFAKTKLQSILDFKLSAAPIAETLSISSTSQKLAQRTLPQDQATALMNLLLASPEGRYNLSKPKAQNGLKLDIEYVKSFIDTPTAPKKGGNDETVIIDDLLHNIGSSLTLTAENFTEIGNAISPLKPLINDALGIPNTPKPAQPAPTTWASLIGWN